MAKREAESPGGESPAAKKIASADDARMRPEDDVVVRILVPYRLEFCSTEALRNYSFQCRWCDHRQERRSIACAKAGNALWFEDVAY